MTEITDEERTRRGEVAEIFATRIVIATTQFEGQIQTPMLEVQIVQACIDIIDEFVNDGHFTDEQGVLALQGVIKMIGEKFE